ncbi:MAG TPA: fused MFS/spermidine synthase [Pirellulaceae bacterium]
MNDVATAPAPPIPAARRPVAGQGGSAVIAAYAITIFTSAFLLFQVQPLISKFILPWFGGSPAVWTAAMLFFQIVLFGGYLYAHLTSTYLSARGQFVLHLALLSAAAALTLYTQISPSESLKPTGDEQSPLLKILLLLGATVGVPYFALSSTGPLLQKWFSDAFHGASPYRLFALSNVGSLLALLTYPFVFEVLWDSRDQARMWSIGFAVFALCCSFCAWWTYQARQAQSRPTQTKLVAAAEKSATAQPAISFWLRLAWIGLPALASVMFLAVTNEVCQNVATVPLLWIIPLSFYLLSFIIAFDHPRWYSRLICTIAAIVLLVGVAGFSNLSSDISDLVNSTLRLSEANEIDLTGWVSECTVYFSALLLVCLICHCELAALKPGPKQLTSYFLSMSLGGALGGILVNLAAPHLFTTFFELPLAILAATLVAGCFLWLWAKRLGRGSQIISAVATAAALLIIANWQILADLSVDPNADRVVLHRARSFFGVVSVEHSSRNDPRWEHLMFRSGHIPHGYEYTDPARRHTTEIAYYSSQSGCGVALNYKLKQGPCRIGVVGLGAGTIAAYGRPGDYLRMYEINPDVTKIARDYFHYLSDCPAEIDVVLGDARLKLEQELRGAGGKGNEFDVLVLDAFSGDAIPTHLLTTEAFDLYKQHLKPGGILAAHITNSYLDLYPVVKGLADEHGFGITRIYLPRVPDSMIERTYYALLTTDRQFLDQTPELLVEMPANFQKARRIPLWTDRYHNLFQVLR